MKELRGRIGQQLWQAYSAIVIILCFPLFAACSSEEEVDEYPYVIAATVKHCEGCVVKLKAGVHRKFERIDTAVVKEGVFLLRGQIREKGFYDVELRAPKRFITVEVFLPADSIHLEINAASKIRKGFYENAELPSPLAYAHASSTSPMQQEVERYLLLRDSLWVQYLNDRDTVVAKFRKTYDSGNRVLINQWADSVENFRYRAANYWSYAADLFIKGGASSEASVYAMLDNRSDRMATERFREYFEALPAAQRQSPAGRYLDEELRKNEERNKNNQRFVGGRIRELDFAGKTLMGKEVDERTIFEGNKLTLVEFWASWCGPCRMQMPAYYELLEQHRDKGFGMIAVSMDIKREMWVRAIEEDGLKVHHISELKGAGGEEMKRFEIKGIPANMLIDNTGKILAVDISRVDLKNRLEAEL